MAAAQAALLMASLFGVDIPVIPFDLDVEKARAAGNAGVQLNGTTQYVTFGAAPALNASSFTLETWFKRTGTGTPTTTSAAGGGGLQSAVALVTKGRGEADSGTNVDTNYFLGIDTANNRLAADYEEGAGQAQPSQNHSLIGATTITNDVWHHAAATFDGTTLRLYLDGTLDATLVVGAGRLPRSDSIQHAGLGAALTSTGSAGGFFAGVIDEARIWNVARSEGQIQAAKNQEIGPTTGLLGAWRLNEGTGTTAASSAGTTINGTLSPAATPPTWVTGFDVTNAGLRFNGTSQYVGFGNPAGNALGASTFTLETWFMRTGVGVPTTTSNATGGGLQSAVALVAKGRGEADAASNLDTNYFLGIDTATNRLAADYEEGAGQAQPSQNHSLIGATTITNNTWHHAAATFDGTTLRLYLDGTLDATLAVGAGRLPRSDSIQHAGLGAALTSTGAAAGFFAGVIDEARIWNVARSEAQIRAAKDTDIAPTAGLIGAWHLNEGSGTIATNSSGTAINGTLNSNPVGTVPSWVDGFVPPGENGLDLGSAGAYATFGDPAKLDLPQFTIETWFKRTGAGVSGTSGNGGIAEFIPLVTHGAPESEGDLVDANWMLGIDDDTDTIAADWEAATGSANQPLSGATPITLDTWHHAALTYDGTTMRLYLDGRLDGSRAAAPPNSDTTQHAGLGVMLESTGNPENDGNSRFQGVLDEVRVWSAARDLAQIRATINEHPPTTTAGLVARWPMDEGAGGVIADATTNPAHGTIVGNGTSRVAGAPFDITFDTTAPDAPTGLGATAADASVHLDWTANTEGDLAGYRVYRSLTPGAPPTGPPLSGSTPLTNASYDDTTAVNGTTYHYVVTAIDVDGNESGPSNEVSATPQAAPGDFGLDLGPTGAYVALGNATELDLAQFTIETWFKRTGPGISGTTGAGGLPAFLPLMANGGPEDDVASNIDANWLLGIDDATDVLAADFEEGASATTPGQNHPVRGVTPITEDVWHHAAATYDGQRWRLYLDGRLEATLFVGEPVRSDTVQHAALGTLLESDGTPNNASRFEGVLDETRVWNSARTQAEIRATINSELTSPPAGLVARWPMSEGGGGTVADAVASPVATHGTIVGAGAARVAGTPLNVTLDSGAPAAPTALNASGGDGFVGLTWAASGSADVFGYRVYRGTSAGVATTGAGIAGPDPVAGTTFTDSTAVAGTTYHYVVVAVDTSGNASGPSNEDSAAPTAAPVGHALDLGGGHVTFGQASGLGSATFTIETWFRRDGAGTPAATSGGTGGINAIPLVTKGRGETDSPASVNMNWFLGIDAATGVLAADFEDTSGGDNHPLLGSTAIASGWHHAAATYDGTTLRLYLDGVLDGQLTVGEAAEATSIQHAALGTAMDSTGLAEGAFDGALDEVRVWSVARSAAQIDSTKNAELTTASGNPGLIGRWGMDETSPTTVSASVGSIHGTIVGTATRIDGAPLPSDPVLVGAGDIAVCGQDDDEATADLLDDIPGTVFTAGDNAYDSGSATEFANCYDPSWGRHKDRTMPAVGNHEYQTPGAAGYFGYFGAAAGDPAEGYYGYDRGTWRIYSLNTEIIGSAMTAQAAWLRDDLEAHPGANVMAVFHKPRFSSAANHGNDPVSQPLWDVLYEFGAELIVVGHDHSYERFAPQSPTGVADAHGIRQFVAGTGGRSHYALGTLKANSEVYDSTSFGVLKFTLHEHSYSWRFIPTGRAGETFTDSGVALTVDPVADAVPSAPTGLSAAPGDNSVSLTWDPSGEPDLAGYNVYGGLVTPNPAVDPPLNGATLLTTPAFDHLGLTNGSTYHYVVTAVDDSDHESTASNEVTATPFEPSPHALDFDGSNDHVTFGAAPELGLTTFTIEAWVRRDGTGVGIADVSSGLPDSVPLITKGRSEGETPATNMNWFVGLDEATGVLQADFEDKAASASHPVTGVRPLDIGSWYHIAVTYDGTTWRLYVNGALDKTETENATPESLSTQHAALATAMDTAGAASGRFNGVLDEVRIWNLARSQTQIQAAMGNEIASASGLVGRWGMNEGNGNTVQNSIAGSPNGTTSGGPQWVGGTPFVSDANSAPAMPTSPLPADGATGVSVSPNLRVNVSDPDGDPVTTSFYGRPVAASPGEEFTIVVIPDTQHYVDNAGRTATFNQQTQWIVDNRDDLNIVFASQVGDITESFDTQEVEFQRADSAMDILDDNGIPNNIAPGNHDFSSPGAVTSNFFDEYFPPSRYNIPANPWYGGWLGEEAGQTQRLNKDNYELFSAGGMDFVIVHLEIDMPTYATAWANEIFDRYPDRIGILSTHAFVNTSNARGTSTVTGRTNGQSAATVWTNLISPNCNVRFVVNGHYPGEGRTVTNNSCGLPVHQLLTDYQARTNGGDGWLRYYTFKPSENKVYAYTYSPKLGAFEPDADSQFTLDFPMNGNAPFELIGNVTGSGPTATLAWPGRAPATEYEWYASVSDGSLTTIGPTLSFTTGTPASNNPPVVSNPGNQTHAEGSVVDVAVPANDVDGDGLTWSATGLPAGLSIGSSTGHITGTIAFTAAAASPYAVTVNVTDGRGPAVPTSFTWTVTNVNREPTFDQNVPNQTHDEGAVISLDAGATDLDGDALTYAATGLPAGLSINATTGLITGTISFAAAASSPYNVAVTVRDGPTVDATDTFTWTVANVNGNPTFDQNLGNRTDPENAVVSLDAGATDPDGDPLTYAATNLPPGLAIDAGTGLITGTIAFTAAATSPYAVSITVRDGATVDATDTFTWTVTNLNREPTFDQDVPNQANAEGSVISLDAGATDPDADALTYAATNLPPGLSINTASGLITGTIAFTASATPYNVSVTVRDGATVDATDSFTWTVANVNREPTFDQDVTNRTDPEGAVISLDAGATDPDGDPLTYAATGLPPGLSINTTTGLITGTLPFTAAAGSPYSVSVTVRDGPDIDATDTFSWTVTDVAPSASPVYRAGSFSSNNTSSTSIVLTRPAGTVAGDLLLLSLDVRGTSTVSAPAGWTLLRTDTYTSSLRKHTYWRFAGAGDPASWTFTFSGSRLAAGAMLAYTGVHPTTPIDASGGLAATTTSATSTAPSITTTVANTTLVALYGSMGNATWTPPAGFSERGDLVGASSSQFVSILAADAARAAIGATGTQTATATASAGNVAQLVALRPAPGGPPPVNNEPTFDQDVPNQTNAENAVVSLDAGATDLDGDPLTYAATGLPAGLSIAPGTGLITGTIAFTAAAGSPYAVSVTVRDGATVDATDTFTWTVTNVNREPTFDQDLGDRTDVEGTVIDIDAGGTDPDGDPLTYAATGLPAGLVISTTTGRITGTIDAAAAASSPYSVAITVRDGATVDATDTFTWTVTDAPPPNQPPTFDQDLLARSDAENSVIALDAGATDPEGDPLTYAATGLPTGLSISPTTGLITGTIAFTAAAGSPYNVSITVRDGPAVDATDTFTWTVTNVNREPTFDQDLGDRTNPEGAVISLDAGGTDPDGDALTYAATNLPAGLSINSATGLITGTIASTAAPGPYAVSITIRDGATIDATDTFSWTVTDVAAGANVTFRAASSGSNNTSSTSIVLSRPAGTQTGDLLVTGLAVRGTSTVTAPAGWTLIRTDTYTSSLRMHLYRRFAAAADPATWTWTFSGSRLAAGAMHAYSGVDPTTPIDVSGGQPAASPSPSSTTPSITTTVPNTMLVTFFANMASSTWTSPAGFTERADLVGTSSSQSTSLVSADALRAATGATGTFVATATASSGNAAQIVALRPAAGGPPPVNREPTFDQDLPNRTDPEGTVINLDAGATDLDGDPLVYGATNLPPGLSINTSSGLITGTIASNAAPGPYNVSITVRDTPTGGPDATDTFTWNVTDVVTPNREPTFDQDLGNRTDPEGTVVNLDAGATDLDGDTLVYGATNLPPGLSINTSTGLITGTISSVAAASSPYSVSITVRDGPTVDATDTFTWTVTDVVTPPAGSIAYRAGSFSSNNASSTSIVLARPTGTQTGDLLLLSLDVRGTSTVTAPAGWTLIRTDTFTSSLRKHTYWRFATAADPATWTFTFSGSRLAAGAMLAFSGVHATTPIDASGGAAATGNSTACTAPSITTTVANTRLVTFFASMANATWTPPTGFTERGDLAGTSGSQSVSISAADMARPAAGATGAQTATASASQGNVAHIIALRPAP